MDSNPPTTQQGKIIATHPPPKFRYLKKEEISRLPKNPGVYSFKRGGEFLYIGKASNIRDRVKQHQELLSLAKQLGYLKTNSEIEALILEANLIKKYQPKYNVVWRDDKNYFFVGITKENFPRIFITHQPTGDAKYVGPFVDGKALKQALKILRKVFPYRSCRNLPKRPCLWYQLNRCLAPCLFTSKLGKQIGRYRISAIRKGGQQNAKNLMKILQGKKKQTLKDLKKEMKMASHSQDFEKAAKIRNQITALEKVLSYSKILQWTEAGFALIRRSPNYHEWREIIEKLRKILKTKSKISRIEAYDISNIQGEVATGSMVTFINGQPDKNFYRRFKIKITGKPNDIAMLKEILNRRFKHPEWPFPDLILVDGGRAQLNAAKLTIKQFNNLTIPVMALAKRKNELYLGNLKKPLLLKSLPREIFNLMLQLRDEAHRFAIAYHHKLRTGFLIPK